MLTHFPKVFSTSAIKGYLATLAIISVAFMDHALPFQYMLFGLVPILVFFTYVPTLTKNWQKFNPRVFMKKLFIAAFIIRAVCVVFIYFYYLNETGRPFKYGTGDDTFYAEVGTYWHDYGFQEASSFINEHVGLSDRGYCWWIAFEGFLMGTHVLWPRLVKCLIDAFSCVLIYKLAKRNFGESTGRIAAILCMLMPNMWYYCGVTLKETEMAFMTILFVERADYALRAPKLTFANIILPGIVILLMFTFRTALAAVLVAAFTGALLLSSGKQLQLWKKVLYGSVFVVWMVLTVGAEMIQETQELWAARNENQETGYQWRAERSGGNTFAKYASASVFAPLILTIPFPTVVAVPTQENQMMMNGANFIKNVLSGLTILALFLLIIRGDWRKHVLPMAVMIGYLVVLVFSNFAHSERFHFPILALELMFVAYGVSQLTNKHKRMYTIWLVFICIANVLWTWIKLKGKGMI